MFSGGYFTVGRIRRVPIRVHFTTPIGLYVFTGLSSNLTRWAGLLFIILIHELGHAALVRRYRLSVESIDISGIGGGCRWTGPHVTDVQRSVIAWGGVLAQGVLLVLLEMVGKTIGFGSTVVGQVAETLVVPNLLLIIINLLPFPPLDGATAWSLFRWDNLHLWGRRSFFKYRAAAIERDLERLTKEDEGPPSEPSQPRFLH